MKVLMFTSNGQDNLEDACLHGMRMLFGANCVDYPKKEVMYKGYAARSPDESYGRLFTLWRSLDDIPVDRSDIEARLKHDYFDLVIFGSIHRTQMFYRHFKPFLKPRKTIIIDGEDDPGVHISAREYLYFKREILSWGAFYEYRNSERVRIWRYGRRARHQNIAPISFALPKEKITAGVTRANKIKLFPQHLVDEEIKKAMRPLDSLDSPAAATSDAPALDRGYTMNTEREYYIDLQSSRYGVTKKRGGWDCLRHYEIAANGGVICFRDLQQKPAECAPHNLTKNNCISYVSAQDLMKKIGSMKDGEYDEMLANSYRWASLQTTEMRALQTLETALRRWNN
jgi:hypothetical protein